jgi:hypothetical protein
VNRLTVLLLVVATGGGCAPRTGTVERVVSAPDGGATAVQLLHVNGGATIPDSVSLCLLRKHPIPEPGEEFLCPPTNRIIELNAFHGLTIVWKGPTELELSIRQDARYGAFVRECEGVHVTLERYEGYSGNPE